MNSSGRIFDDKLVQIYDENYFTKISFVKQKKSKVFYKKNVEILSEGRFKSEVFAVKNASSLNYELKIDYISMPGRFNSMEFNYGDFELIESKFGKKMDKHTLVNGPSEVTQKRGLETDE